MEFLFYFFFSNWNIWKTTTNDWETRTALWSGLFQNCPSNRHLLLKKMPKLYIYKFTEKKTTFFFSCISNNLDDMKKKNKTKIYLKKWVGFILHKKPTTYYYTPSIKIFFDASFVMLETYNGCFYCMIFFLPLW